MNAISLEDFHDKSKPWEGTKVLFLTQITNLLGEHIEAGSLGTIKEFSKTKELVDDKWTDGFFNVEVDGRVYSGVHCSRLSLEVDTLFIVFYKFNRKDMPQVISLKTIISQFIGSVQEKEMIKHALAFERQILGAMICYGSYGKLSDEVWNGLFVEYKTQSIKQNGVSYVE